MKGGHSEAGGEKFLELGVESKNGVDQDDKNIKMAFGL